MRITNNMIVNNMMFNLGENLNRMSKIQEQLTTGKKISKASDDPVVAARALKLRTDVSEIEQYQRNVDDAISWMEMSESTVGQIGDVLQRVRELSVQASNGTNTPDDLQKIKEEIKQLKNQTINLSNNTYAGRNIFSGFKTDKDLIDEDGNFLIEVEKTEKIIYEIGIGDTIAVNVLGGDLFNNGGETFGATSGKVTGDFDITTPLTISAPNDTLSLSVDAENINITLNNTTYSTIEDVALEIQNKVNAQTTTANDITVEANANKLIFTSGSTGVTSIISIDGTSSAAADLGLNTNTQVDGSDKSLLKGSLIQTFDNLITALDEGNSDSISSILGVVDSDLNSVLRVRADIGARMNRLELTSNRLSTYNINFTKLMSQNEDVDMAETIMNLQNEENVYKASLAGGAKIIQPSLVDFLR